MRAAVVEVPGGPIEIAERPVPRPGVGQVLLKVLASGVCHTDADIKAGQYPQARFPLVLGHEIAAEVAELGPDRSGPPVGTRVGLTWTYFGCGHCRHCLVGDAILCADGESTGVTVPGGHQEYVVAWARHIFPLPETLAVPEAAPLMCAGLTAFAGLALSGSVAGRRVAVLGLGGIGRYVACYASAMGARVAVVSGAASKERQAYTLGAELFINRRQTDPFAALRSWDGGPEVMVATAPNSEMISELSRAIAATGKLIVLGIGTSDLHFTCHDLIDRRLAVLGSPGGSSRDMTGLLDFAAHLPRHPPVVAMPLEQAAQAYDLTLSGEASGRVILTMS